MKPAIAWTIAAIGMAAAFSHAFAQNVVKEGEKILLEGAKSQITPTAPGTAATGAVPGAQGVATSVPGAQNVTTMVPGAKDITGKVSGMPGTAAPIPGAAAPLPGAAKAAGTSVTIPGVSGPSVTTPAVPGVTGSNVLPALTTTPPATAPSR